MTQKIAPLEQGRGIGLLVLGVALVVALGAFRGGNGGGNGNGNGNGNGGGPAHPSGALGGIVIS